MNDYDYFFKILLIGDSKVGKSSMLIRYTDGIFTDNYWIAIGFEFKIKTITWDNKEIKFEIWDTAGEESFRSIAQSYFKGSDGIILMYDCNNRESFDNLIYWRDQLKTDADKDAFIILVGNKKELFNAVSSQEAQEFAQSSGWLFFEASSKNNEGIEDVFNTMANRLVSISKAKSKIEEKKVDSLGPAFDKDSSIKTAVEVSSDTDEDYIMIKAVLIGETGTGKTSFSNRIMRNEFNYELKTTVGVEFESKAYLYKNKKFKLQLWDTAGQQRYKAITSSYYRSSKAVFLVYDCTNQESFFKLKGSIKEIHEHCDPNAKLIIIGNKYDIENKVISTTQGKALADYIGAKFFEISCKEGFSYIDIITELLCQINEEHLEGESARSLIEKFINLTLNEDFNENSSIFQVETKLASTTNIPKRPESQEYDYLFKLLIIGDSGTGKSSILNRYVDGTFTETHMPTIGLDFKVRTFEHENLVVKLQIWNTAGQERFRSIISSYYKEAHGILLVFDYTDENSFNNLKNWLSEIHNYALNDIPVILAGNKIDLESMKQVSNQDALAYAHSHKLQLFDISCKQGKGIEEAFTGITKLLIRTALPVKQEIKEESISTQIIEETKKDQTIKSTEIIKYKIVLSGDAKIGKTSFWKRLTKNGYNDEYMPTCGIDFFSMDYSYSENSFKLQFWDTSGQERFRSLLPTYFRCSNTVILIYDCTNKQSFFDLKSFIETIHNSCDDNLKLIIIGNKCDKEDKIINTIQGNALADYLGAAFFEISCKNGFTSSNVINKILSPTTQENVTKESTYSRIQQFINLTSNEGFNENCSIFDDCSSLEIKKKLPVTNIPKIPEGQDYDYLFKLLIIGDSGTGKTSILNRYADGTFTEIYVSTIGVDFKIRTFEHENLVVKLQIWDTAGQERFRSIIPPYYKGAHGILLVFDYTDENSFNYLKNWLSEIHNYALNDIPVILVGNKIDLESMKQVSIQDALVYAHFHKLQLFDISCKQGKGIEEAFAGITKLLIKKNLPIKQEIKEESISTQIIEETKKDQTIKSTEIIKYKIVLSGDAKIGKTSFWKRLTKNGYNDEYMPTCGIDFFSMDYSYNENSFKLQIWDTSGQERFRSLLPSYFRSSNAAILIYDCTNKQSFFNLKHFIETIHSSCDDNIKLILIGNKCDKEDKIINTIQGNTLADYLGAAFFEISCKNGFNSSNIINKILSPATAENATKESTYSRIQQFISLTSNEGFNENCSIFVDCSNFEIINIPKIPEGHEYDFLFKLLLIGDSGSGKSAIFNRYVNNTFNESYFTTMGIDFKLKIIQLENLLVKLHIRDTAGQKRFRTNGSSYYEHAHGILLVYDITNEEHFNNLEKWLQEIERYAGRNIPIFLIANKIDLNLHIAISRERALDYSQAHQLKYFETSSKNNQGIDEVFSLLIRELMKKNNENTEDKTSSS